MYFEIRMIIVSNTWTVIRAKMVLAHQSMNLRSVRAASYSFAVYVVKFPLPRKNSSRSAKLNILLWKILWPKLREFSNLECVRPRCTITWRRNFEVNFRWLKKPLDYVDNVNSNRKTLALKAERYLLTLRKKRPDADYMENHARNHSNKENIRSDCYDTKQKLHYLHLADFLAKRSQGLFT